MAVIDVVAASSGLRVDVYGHSQGGMVALGAAAPPRLSESWSSGLNVLVSAVPMPGSPCAP